MARPDAATRAILVPDVQAEQPRLERLREKQTENRDHLGYGWLMLPHLISQHLPERFSVDIKEFLP